MSENKLFYIQDTRNTVGNSMLWWELYNRGYVCDIKQARIFSELDAHKICDDSESKRMWPVEYINKRVSHHIDMQHCDFEQALKGK